MGTWGSIVSRSTSERGSGWRRAHAHAGMLSGIIGTQFVCSMIYATLDLKWSLYSFVQCLVQVQVGSGPTDKIRSRT
jgi:hypothetical protein